MALSDLQTLAEQALNNYKKTGKFDLATTSALIRSVLNYSEAIPGSVPAQLVAADVPALTDNSGGTSGVNTIAVVTNPVISGWDGATVFPSAGDATNIKAAITALTNAVATLAAKNNAMRTALVNAGLMT